MDFISFFNQGWFGVLAGAAVGLFFFHRSKRDPHISYQVSTEELISRVPQSLKDRVLISLDGKQTDDVSNTRLAIWNSGNAVIKLDSFPAGGELYIEIENISSILGFEVLTVSNKTNEVKATSTSYGISILLNYLNPGDGFIIGILDKSDIGRIRLNGILFGQKHSITFKGNVAAEKLMQSTFVNDVFEIFNHLFNFLFSIALIWASSTYWAAYTNGTVIIKSWSPNHHFYAAIVLFIFGLLGLIGVFFTSRRPPQQIYSNNG